MSNKVGRPSDSINARDSLILTARNLFSRQPYEKVSIRLIAEKSGVSSALIKYYFGNKYGLFEAMIIETFHPISMKLRTARNKEDFDSIASLLKTFYQAMIAHPDYARFVYRLLTSNRVEERNLLSPKILESVYVPGSATLFENLDATNDTIDRTLLRLSFFSLMYFPFLASEGMLKFHGIEMTPEFLQRLAEHNLELLKRSIFL